LIKHRDKYVEPGDTLVEKHTTSVVTKRTMDQIGGSTKSRVWHSNRPADGDGGDEGDGAPRKRSVSIAEARAARAKARAASTPEE
jgi:hypothetical protein